MSKLKSLGLSYMGLGTLLMFFAGFAENMFVLASGGLVLLVGGILRVIGCEGLQDSSMQDWEYFYESN